MTYTLGYKAQFAIEFERYQEVQQRKVLQFVQCYYQHGLNDFSVYKGKISPSWKGAPLEKAAYARQNALWHYHIGLPTYRQSPSGSYLTSDQVLHFQWKDKGKHVDLVDLYDHYDRHGNFWIPPLTTLA